MIKILMPTADDRPAVLELLELCNRFDGMEMPVTPAEMPANTIELAAFDNETLVGYAAAVVWGGEPELSGCVHPQRRRQGVATLLLEAALKACRERGDSRVLVVCDERLPAGLAFVKAQGAQFAHAEHRLRLEPERVNPNRPRRAELQLRPATAADLDTMARIQAAAFGDPESEMRDHVRNGLAMPSRQYFIGELSTQPVGMLRVGRYEQGADVTSFGVLPEHQGRGYGRQMLSDTADLLLAEGWREITIEVDTANANALGLYQSCGFVVQASYGYYALDL